MGVDFGWEHAKLEAEKQAYWAQQQRKQLFCVFCNVGLRHGSRRRKYCEICLPPGNMAYRNYIKVHGKPWPKCARCLVKPREVGRRLYCSAECRLKVSRQRSRVWQRKLRGALKCFTIDCENCGDEFTYERVGRSRKFCSVDCRNQANRTSERARAHDRRRYANRKT